MPDLTSTVDDYRLRPSPTRFSVSSAALKLLCGERDRCSNCVRLLAGQFSWLVSDFNILLASAQNRRATLFRGASLLVEDFHAPPGNDYMTDVVPMPLPAE